MSVLILAVRIRCLGRRFRGMQTQMQIELLKARFSYKLVQSIVRYLPEGISRKVVQFLGLKIPTTPEMLGASLLVMAAGTLKTLGETCCQSQVLGIQKDLPAPEDTMTEFLCAYYSLAVTVLSHDAFGAEPNLFRVYTASTFLEIKKLLAATEGGVQIEAVERLMEQVSNFYFRNESINEDVLRLEGFWYAEELETVVRMNDWFCSFTFKAQARIMSSLALGTGHIAYPLLSAAIKIAFLENAKTLKRLRPVLVN